MANDTTPHHILKCESEIENIQYRPDLLDTIISDVHANIPSVTLRDTSEGSNILGRIAQIINRYSFKYDVTVKAFHETINPNGNVNKTELRANCHTMSLIYSAIGEALDMPIKFIAIPCHASVRWYFSSNTYCNWDPLAASIIDGYNIDSDTAETGFVTLTPSSFAVYEGTSLVVASLIQTGGKLGTNDAALLYLNQAINLCSNCPAAYEARSDYFILLGNSKCAKRDLLTWQSLSQDPVECYRRGKAFYDLGETSQAITDLTVAITAGYGISFVQAWRGAAFLVEQRYTNAIEDFTRVIELSPDDTRAYTGRAYCYYSIGDTNKAIIDYNKAIELGDSSPSTMKARFALLLRMGQYSHVIQETTKVISERISEAQLLMYRASAYLYVSNIIAAKADLDLATSKCGNDANDYDDIARLYVSNPDIRNGRRAVELATRSVELSREAQYLRTLSCAYAECNEFESAIRYINEAISITPDIEYTKLSIAFSNKVKYIEFKTTNAYKRK